MNRYDDSVYERILRKFSVRHSIALDSCDRDARSDRDDELHGITTKKIVVARQRKRLIGILKPTDFVTHRTAEKVFRDQRILKLFGVRESRSDKRLQQYPESLSAAVHRGSGTLLSRTMDLPERARSICLRMKLFFCRN